MDSCLYLKQEEFEKIFKKHLKISSYSMSIRTLFGERLSRKIKYDPYYQRNYVWDKVKASFFIESILLGTDIPPLIFFNSEGKIEVIDGRQRFETIKRFKQNELVLNLNGLLKLPQFQKHSFNKLDNDIKDIFDDTKIRIFEFEVINEPRLESSLEDKIKKEIFRRYNSGITPLNTSEIDNASYDEDQITGYLKRWLAANHQRLDEVINCFLGPRGSSAISRIAMVLQFFRKCLVLTEFPISAYAGGNNRNEIFQLYYSFLRSNTENIEELCKSFIAKIESVLDLRSKIRDDDIRQNKLIFECILWAINVITRETDRNYFSFDEVKIAAIESHYQNNMRIYSSDNSFYYRSVIDRFQNTAYLFQELYDIDFAIYLKDAKFKDRIKELRQSEKDAKLKLEELAGLRANKPDPSLVPVDEIVSELNTTRYLLRPSYQRQEKISVYKSSAIIESIILGISLPPIFIFKNPDNTKEVVDGQQRLISILSYVGRQYRDETGRLHYTNNPHFALTSMKILRELNGKRYSELEEHLKDKILGFNLQIVEIGSAMNPNFDPVDLFIRLNNKPFPIPENSFEMWNSFVDKDVIQRIKDITDENIRWFFIKVRAEDKSKDRMHNEEMISMLAYIDYKADYTNSIGIYKRDEKLSCRIKDKDSISSLLEELSTKEREKQRFLRSLDRVECFIKNLDRILDSTDNKNKLNELFGLKARPQRGVRRSLVDFYILYLLLGNLNETNVERICFEHIKEDFVRIQNMLRNSGGLTVDDSYLSEFHKMLGLLINKYKSISY